MTRYVLFDELAGSIGEMFEKHLPGQHDQKLHGRRGSAGITPATVDVAGAETSGQPMGLDYIPAPLADVFASSEIDALQAMALDRTALLWSDLGQAAMQYAESLGLKTEPQGWYATLSEAEIYALAVTRRRADVSMQDEAWNQMSEHDRETLHTRVVDYRDQASVVVAMPIDALEGVEDTGRVMSQFEVGESRGNLDADLRAIEETKMLDYHPNVDYEHRPIYGFLAKPGHEGQMSVDQYGEARVVLKDEVRSRSTMTVGDSLSTHSHPIPVDGPVSERQVSDATERTIFGGVERSVIDRPQRFLHNHYLEAQIHGGIDLSDIKEIHLPSDIHRYWDPDAFAYYSQQFGEQGIKVKVYEPYVSAANTEGLL